MDFGKESLMWIFLRYISVGSFNTLIGLSIIFISMHYIGLSPFISNFFGYLLGLVISYFMHKVYTFKSYHINFSNFLIYLVIFFIAYLSNLFSLYLFINFIQFDMYISQILSMSIYVLFSFFLYRRFLGRKVF